MPNHTKAHLKRSARPRRVRRGVPRIKTDQGYITGAAVGRSKVVPHQPGGRGVPRIKTDQGYIYPDGRKPQVGDVLRSRRRLGRGAWSPWQTEAERAATPIKSLRGPVPWAEPGDDRTIMEQSRSGISPPKTNPLASGRPSWTGSLRSSPAGEAPAVPAHWQNPQQAPMAPHWDQQRLPARRTPSYQGVFGQSLFGGSGAGTPQQFQSTPYRGSSLTGAYQHAYDQARAQNENRYNRILGGYGELLGQRSPYQAQRMNVHDLYDRRTSDIHANLVGRGLTAGTVGMAPQALNERERQFALADIGDKETRYKSDIAQDQLDFMERKTEAYPDYEQLERLSQGLGAGGRGLGGGGRGLGGGGGGMGAAKAYQSSWKPYGGGWLARRKSVPGGMPGRGGLEFARQHQKVGMSSFGGFGGIAANYGNPNQYVPVISPVAGGAPIERQMFPGQYDMARRMMTPTNLGRGYGGGQRGGGQRGGAPMDEMSYIRQARRFGYSVDEARQLYRLYQKQQAQRQAGMGAPQQGARRGTPSALRARQVEAYGVFKSQLAAWNKHQALVNARKVDAEERKRQQAAGFKVGPPPAPLGPGPQFPDRPGGFGSSFGGGFF